MNNLNNFTNEELELLESALLRFHKTLLEDKRKYSDVRYSYLEKSLTVALNEVWDVYCKVSALTDKDDEE